MKNQKKKRRRWFYVMVKRYCLAQMQQPFCVRTQFFSSFYFVSESCCSINFFSPYPFDCSLVGVFFNESTEKCANGIRVISFHVEHAFGWQRKSSNNSSAIWCVFVCSFFLFDLKLCITIEIAIWMEISIHWTSLIFDVCFISCFLRQRFALAHGQSDCSIWEWNFQRKKQLHRLWMIILMAWTIKHRFDAIQSIFIAKQYKVHIIKRLILF